MNHSSPLPAFWAFSALGFLPSLPGPCAAGTKPPVRPDILFIFADDQSHEALSVFGSEAKTPNLDRLVSDGVTFTHAYNQGSWTGAVCVASRTMLNTGRILAPALEADGKMKNEVEAGRSHEAIHASYLDLQRMVCKGDHKLIHYPAINKYRLYNLREDPQEIHDLAADPDYAEVIADLEKSLPDFVTTPDGR